MVSLFFLRLYRRLLVAGGALALASWVFGAGPFWSAEAALGGTNSSPQVTVNQFGKGDRLPMIERSSVWHDLPVPQTLQNKPQVPFGCDRAFSPVAAPAAKSIYGRCLA